MTDMSQLGRSGMAHVKRCRRTPAVNPATSQGLGFGPLAQGGVARFFGNKNTQYVLVFVVTNEIKH